VAVHSTADADALHVAAADESVCIGEPLPAQSYLRIDAIIEAAKRCGADAIHPGYGFLAENELFAQACADAGIVFVGPSAAAILAMGHKAGAKQLMLDAGVPCIPGYQGADQSEATLLEQARMIGFPLMIKATAGGGGRGMRLVHSDQTFVELLHSAKSEARSAFGDDEVLLERAIIEPRHIEIQLMADRYGNAVHLGERDCSVQRRHQKVIEESPSPAVNAELRARMGQTAVDAVKAIAYEGAGTLEFLLDRQGHYYFMEMNTRLQVEHPVTEAVTGLDLVELQLRVASGDHLGLTQDDVTLQGHAIEVRLCAEEPLNQFMPQSGDICLWRPSPLLRVEHGLNTRSRIAPYYDSMVAKVIAFGQDRDEALRRLCQGLSDTVALGIGTNQQFLMQCLQHPVFVQGGATTAFIAQNQEALLAVDPLRAKEAAAIAAALLHASGSGSLSHGYAVPMRLGLGETVIEATLTHGDGAACTLRMDQQQFEIEILSVNAPDARLVCNGVGRKLVFLRDGNTVLMHLRGQAWRVEDLTHEAVLSHAKAGGDGKMRASMNGRVIAVMAQVGDTVVQGQPLLTLEAMKMEHVHLASSAGVLSALHAAIGDQVSAHRVLAEIQPDAALHAA
jgi:geranyl-CoA carboxylase alpha subunit